MDRENAQRLLDALEFIQREHNNLYKPIIIWIKTFENARFCGYIHKVEVSGDTFIVTTTDVEEYYIPVAILWDSDAVFEAEGQKRNEANRVALEREQRRRYENYLRLKEEFESGVS